MNEYAALMNEYAAAITAAATLALAALTLMLGLENRALRKAGSSPYISAFLRPHPEGTGGVDMIIANVGKGPAFDVCFNLEHDYDDFAAHRVLFTDEPDRPPINAIPQDDNIKFLFGLGFQLYGNIGNYILYLATGIWHKGFSKEARHEYHRSYLSRRSQGHGAH